MEETLLDEKTKTFLIACLVTGIDVNAEVREFMLGLVEHMNSIERPYWTVGDEDGVIIHDKHDQPFLMLQYSGTRITFRTFDVDEFTGMETNKNIGFSLLNVLDYIRSLDLDFCPSALGSESSRVTQSDDTSDTNPEDWAL